MSTTEKPIEYKVKLLPAELLLLDGKCSPQTQLLVEQCKHAAVLGEGGCLTQRQCNMIAKIVRMAKESGRVTFCATRISTCPSCGRNDGYYCYPGSSRTHRKGAPNYDTPKTFIGYDLNRGFVTMKNTIWDGWCESCDKAMRPAVLSALDGVRCEIPESLSGSPPKYLRFDNKQCKCGWTGHEGEMGLLPTLFDNGRYRGKCPKCSAENHLFTTNIKTVDGFTIVEAENK